MLCKCLQGFQEPDSTIVGGNETWAEVLGCQKVEIMDDEVIEMNLKALV